MKKIIFTVLVFGSLSAKAQLISLCGIWYTHEYGCTPWIPTETFYIAMHEDTAVCTKIIGDSCVTSGHVSWYGVYDSSTFSVQWWGGAPNDPNSSLSPGIVQVLDSMWFLIGGLNVYKYSCVELETMGMDPSDYDLPCSCKKISGISETVSLNNKIFPNPTSTTITLSLPSNQNAILSIFNLLGEKVKEEKVAGIQVTLDVSSLPQGLYLVRMENRVVGKFVKE